MKKPLQLLLLYCELSATGMTLEPTLDKKAWLLRLFKSSTHLQVILYTKTSFMQERTISLKVKWQSKFPGG